MENWLWVDELHLIHAQFPVIACVRTMGISGYRRLFSSWLHATRVCVDRFLVCVHAILGNMNLQCTHVPDVIDKYVSCVFYCSLRIFCWTVMGIFVWRTSDIARTSSGKAVLLASKLFITVKYFYICILYNHDSSLLIFALCICRHVSVPLAFLFGDPFCCHRTRDVHGCVHSRDIRPLFLILFFLSHF